MLLGLESTATRWSSSRGCVLQRRFDSSPSPMAADVRASLPPHHRVSYPSKKQEVRPLEIIDGQIGSRAVGMRGSKQPWLEECCYQGPVKCPRTSELPCPLPGLQEFKSTPGPGPEHAAPSKPHAVNADNHHEVHAPSYQPGLPISCDRRTGRSQAPEIPQSILHRRELSTEQYDKTPTRKSLDAARNASRSRVRRGLRGRRKGRENGEPANSGLAV